MQAIVAHVALGIEAKAPVARCRLHSTRGGVPVHGETIIDGGGDYCLALKGNHPVLHADVERFCTDPDANKLPDRTTIDGDHGRIEERRQVVCYYVEWLFSDRRYADECASLGLVLSFS